MSLLIKGITRISELDIDADKDMTVHGLFNLKEVVASMVRGDIAVRDTNQLIVVAAGPADYVLTSTGIGKIPVYAPAGGGLKYYFPVVISLTNAEVVVPVNQSYNKNAPITREWPIKMAIDNQPALGISQLLPAVASVDAEAIVPVDQSYNKNAPVAREGGVWVTPAVGGAVLDDGGATTDYTAEINSVGANDVKLLPDLPLLVVNDAMYFGLYRPWDQLWLNIGTAGVGNYGFTHEYWNGAWVALAGVVDHTSEFTIAGNHNIRWTRPGDWLPTDVGGVLNLYWIRARVSAVVDYNTQPLGTQGWCEILV